MSTSSSSEYDRRAAELGQVVEHVNKTPAAGAVARAELENGVLTLRFRGFQDKSLRVDFTEVDPKRTFTDMLLVNLMMRASYILNQPPSMSQAEVDTLFRQEQTMLNEKASALKPAWGAPK